ncbi:hypothetical protein M9H77_25531 [Catharanthus roseus]|uniref:Uncharacterized protein n=1 Tax=Catharanthus roseus TaxID=4058 RepID=A0ACC0ABD4_CATRO|nr:hypothetical protein M9H77_25531 [Catharanthus roseus]
MRSFLKDAEEKQESDHRIQQWISEITNISYDTMSILEDFTLKIEETDDKKLGFLDRLHICACICRKQGKSVDIYRKRETYGITNIGGNGDGSSHPNSNSRLIVKAFRRATSYVDEEKIFVGFEDVIDKLVEEILKDEPRRSTLSILGMGGLGKTTVARKLYNSPALLEEFGYRAWVCVSQEYSIPDLLRTIIKSFKKGVSKEELELLDKMNVEDLERELRKTLEKRRYLVVVDDVWHKEAWQSLKRAFPDCKNGSRVIITTRKKDVAIGTDDKCFVHELRFLTQDEGWELFTKRLSCNDDYRNWCSFTMLDVGKEMVQKCGGLPLAIIVLGGLLAHKTKLQEWQKVKDHLWRRMKNESIEISPLLSLSYNDLPSELKQCFLYLGMFPEDYLISAEKLMWFWMAEGLIQGPEEIEDIAEDYLNELIDRNLIQVTKRYWGKIFKIRIHDLLRDLAVEKAMEVRFFSIYDTYKSATPYSSRRCAIHNHIETTLSKDLPNKMLRSILIFRTEYEIVGGSVLKSICQNFKHLCTLDLEDFRFGHDVSLECIGNLIHLRYLGLTNTFLSVFPKSIGKLKSLQVLEAMLGDYVSYQVPTELSKLVNLKHILCRMEGHVNLGSLTNLRSLRYVNCDFWTQTDTTNLINLQELAIERIDQSIQLDSISMLKNLRTLFLATFHH